MEEHATWGDSFIVNLGTDQWEKAERDVAPKDLDNWHVDGDFFVCENPCCGKDHLCSL